MMAIKPLSDPVITTETNDKEIKRKYARQAAEEAQQEELRGAFEMFDMNGDGYKVVMGGWMGGWVCGDGYMVVMGGWVDG